MSHEHKEAGLFGRDEMAGLNMPDGYRRSIHDWYDQIDAGVSA
jgi:hypothetical protein